MSLTSSLTSKLTRFHPSFLSLFPFLFPFHFQFYFSFHFHVYLTFTDKINLCNLLGGVGTFDEIWDSVCGKSLGMKGMRFKPICLINTDGFYDGFVVQMDRSQKEGQQETFLLADL